MSAAALATTHETGATAFARDEHGGFSWPWLGISLAVAAIFLLPTLGYGFGYDHGFLQYLAASALRGKWPYADYWDNAFPGTILLHMAVLAVGGTSVLALRVADFALELATAGLLFVLASRLRGPRAGYYAGCAYAIAYTAGTYYHTAQRDGFLVPFLLAALLGIWYFLERPGRRGTLALAGLSAGIASLIRPTYALVVAIGALALALRGRWETRSADDTPPTSLKDGVIDGAIFAAAGATPLLLFCLVYLVAGRFHAIVELLTLLSTVYPHLERMSEANVLANFVSMTARLIWLGTLLSIPSGVWRERRREMAATAVLFVAIVLVRVWESKGWRYQYWPAIAVLCITAGVGWQWLASQVVARIPRVRARAAAGAFAILSLVLLAQLGRWGAHRYVGLRDEIAANADPARLDHMVAESPTQAQVAGYLRSHVAPDDRVQLWGPETIVLYAVNRFSATRFMDPFMFLCPGPSGLTLFTNCGPSWNKPIQVAFLREFLNGMETHPPAYIVAHYANGSLAIVESSCIAPDLPALRDLLDRRYRAEATFGNWTVFRLQPPGVSETAAVTSHPAGAAN